MERAAKLGNGHSTIESCAGTPQQMSDAIDVVAWLAEQAWKIAGQGAREHAMSEALNAAFGYMVQYVHHVSIDGDDPHDALAKAAVGTNELTSTQLAVLRSVARVRSKPRLHSDSFESTLA